MRIIIIYTLILSIRAQSQAVVVNDANKLAPPFAGFVEINYLYLYEKYDAFFKERIEPKCKEVAKRKERYESEFAKIRDQNLPYEVSKARFDALSLELKYKHGDLEACHKAAEEKDRFGLPIDLYSEPSAKSQKLGTLVMRNGDRISEQYQYYKMEYQPLSGEAVVFHPDIFHADNVEPAYHTALEVRGNWVKLPRKPFPTEVWANFGESPHFGLRIKQIPDAYELTTPSIVGPARIYRIENGFAIGETIEIPPCDCSEDSAEEDGAELQKPASTFVPQKFKIPVKELVDEDGHFNGKRADFPECYCC